MSNAKRMSVIDCFKNFLYDLCSKFFTKFILFGDLVEQFFAFENVRDDVIEFFSFIEFINFQDVCMI